MQKELPVIVWFHGGGLTSGNKSVPAELMDAGYVVVAPNYRLIPEVGVSECIDDAAEAVAWVFENIEKYGGDRKDICFRTFSRWISDEHDRTRQKKTRTIWYRC